MFLRPRVAPCASFLLFVVASLCLPVFARAQRAEPEEDPDTVYRALHQPEPRRLWLTILEEAVFLGGGALWYYLDRGTNIVDWDNPGWDKRLTRDVLRVDNNTFAMNHLGHAGAGTAFYAAARANGSNIFESMALATLTSVAWEYLVEFREKVSVNDLIFTPVSGIAIGEFTTQLGRYLHSSVGRPSRRQRFFAGVFGPMEALHRIGRPSRGLGRPADNLGFSADTWHRFSVQAGVGAGVEGVRDVGVHAAELRVDAELVAMPFHLQTGTFRRFFRDGDLTRFQMRAGMAKERDVDLLAHSTLLGYYQQRTHKDGTGQTWLVGMHMAYRYRRVWFEGFRDDVGLAAVGATARSWTRLRSGLLDVAFDAGPAQSGISSYRFKEWQAENPTAVGKSILHKQGYSYGLGGWAQLSVAYERDWLRLSSRMQTGHFRSINGIDRNQEQVTDDVRTRERYFDVEGSVEVAPLPDSGFVVAASLLSQLRWSELEAMRGKSRLTRGFVTAGFVF